LLKRLPLRKHRQRQLQQKRLWQRKRLLMKHPQKQLPLNRQMRKPNKNCCVNSKKGGWQQPPFLVGTVTMEPLALVFSSD
jgi:hypothetical protein